MAKKAKAKAATPSVMDQLAAYQPPWEDPAPEQGVGDQGEQVKSLTEQLAKMQAQLDGYARQDAYRSFQGAPAPAPTHQGVAPQGKKKLDLTGLPDPVAETEKWQGELTKRMNEVVDAREADIRNEQATRQEQTDLANNLWNGFKEAHPDWADQQRVVGAVAGEVSQSLKARGINVVQLMQQQPALFYKEIVGVLDKEYPQLKKDGGDEDDDGEEGDAQVFGGQVGGKGGSFQKVAASIEDDNKAWLKELGDARNKVGLR